jgi:hypothetical protein
MVISTMKEVTGMSDRRWEEGEVLLFWARAGHL